MNPAYALIYCEKEEVKKTFVVPRGQIQWAQPVDEETKSKGFVAKSKVSIKIKDKSVDGIILQTSSRKHNLLCKVDTIDKNGLDADGNMILDRSSSQSKIGRLRNNVNAGDMKNVKQASKKDRERSVTEYNDQILACSTEQPSSPQRVDESSEQMDPVLCIPGANDESNGEKDIPDIISVTNHHNKKDNEPPSSSTMQEVDSIDVLSTVKGTSYE
ncbi:hypothetical protein HCN44_010232 [Aphidius gifuensis]|uniref:Uncharacterized protein n=1 Tax=Aphidius gifuensis TaxID=684658 RepID=A0A834XXU3_APHGI|nr:hypothetical protein HCN44_010232 [Aphidius gifuensis]